MIFNHVSYKRGISLDHLEIATMPDKINYLVGDIFDPSGMVINAVYSNNAKLVATGYTYSPTGPLSEGTTLITVTYTEGGISKNVTFNVTAEKMSIPIPVVSGSLTYNGNYQSPEWEGYDSDKMTISGMDSAINAGTYQVVFSLKNIVGTQWSDGTITDKTISWSIQKAVLIRPSQSGSLTYNGNSQSPTWINYDPNKITISGQTSGVNAGDYEVGFTPKENYKWSDSEDIYETTWTINKAAGSLTISPTSVTIDANNTSRQITVTRPGDGAISAQSNNTGVATVSVSGNVVTVYGTGNNGNAVITISVGEGTNYTAPSSKTCSVTASYITAGYKVTLTATQGTWTCPASGSWQIEIHGGGGGGGGSYSTSGAPHCFLGAGGGGSGSLYTSSYTRNQTISYTIGRGGAAGVNDINDDQGTDGSDGQPTTFGTFSVDGGEGGSAYYNNEWNSPFDDYGCMPGDGAGTTGEQGMGYTGNNRSINGGNATSSSSPSFDINEGGSGGGTGTYGKGGTGGRSSNRNWDEVLPTAGYNGAIILTFLG